jgi:hypothetical protein
MNASTASPINPDGADATANNNSGKNIKRVTFGQTPIHEHPCVPGDNPSCSGGVPLTIDWKPIRVTVKELAEGQTYKDKKGYHEMRLSPEKRNSMMRLAGYSRQELIVLCKPVNIARARRSKTLETMSLQSLQEMLEWASKGLRKCYMCKGEREKRRTCKQWSNNNASKTGHSIDVSNSTLNSTQLGSNLFSESSCFAITVKKAVGESSN